jgi:ATP-dependent DNA helicase PIF1
MGSSKNINRIRASNTANLYIDGQAKMDWQEKYLLIIDEINMLGIQILYAINQRFCKLRVYM